MLVTMRVGSFSAALSLLVVGAACSVVNAPDDVKVGSGGALASTTTSNPSGGAGGGGTGDGGTGGGGSSATCSADDDCLTSNRCASVVHCESGACVDAGPVVVDDSDPCTVDSCDPATGKVSHEPAVIDDGDACTIDSCDPTSGVQHQSIADDGNACTLDQCDSTTDPPSLTHTKLLGCGCAHSACVEGGPLEVQGCSWARSAEGTCVEKVCTSLPSCCTESWGAECVNAVRALCGQDLGGGGGGGGGSSEQGIDCACAHSYCVKGVALAASCDPCVAEICAKKPACCDAVQGGWTSDCVVATNTLCNAPQAPNCQ